MVAFKKYQGTFSDLVQTMKFPPSFSEIQAPEKFLSELEKDLHRTHYLSFSQTVDSTKNHFRYNSEANSYTQGMLDGGVFSGILNTHSKVTVSNKAVENNQPLEDLNGAIRFSYTDDEGRHCGLSIAYVRDDSNLSLDVNKRPRNYTVAIIRNIEKPPKLRDVVIFSHSKLLKTYAAQAAETHPITEQGVPLTEVQKNLIQKEILNAGKNLDSQQVAQEVTQATCSRTVNALISGIIQGETINLAQFKALSARLKTNRNIDDRDAKLQKLVDIMVHHARSPEYALIKAKLELMIKNSIYDVNYFKEVSLEQLDTLKNDPPLQHDLFKNLQKIEAFNNHRIQQYKQLSFETKSTQSFFSRNFNKTLMLTSFILSAVIAAALTATGILAPAGLALIGTALAIASSAVVTNLVLEERDLAAYQKGRITLQQTIQDESKQIAADCEKALHSFNLSVTARIAVKSVDAHPIAPEDPSDSPRPSASGSEFFSPSAPNATTQEDSPAEPPSPKK